MKKIVLAVLTVSTLLWSCGGGTDAPKGNNNNSQVEAKGGVAYGGVFRVNEVEDFKNLFPLNITEVASFRIAYQVYEGLVRFDQKDLSVKGGLAESWDVNEDATSFTFKLRKGVKFHDDECFEGGKGREVKAQDIAYCFTQLCTASPNNQMFWLFQNRVKGANEYYQSTVDGSPLEEGVVGIKVIDDYTLQIDLDLSFAGFINILGHNGCWIYPKEAYDKYGSDMRVKCVGTGPFRVKNIKEGEAVILAKNPDYYKKDKYGNKLPYLDAIKVSFLKEKKSELLEFKKGNLDMVFRLPLEMIDEVTGALEEAKSGGNAPFVLQNTPAYAVHYYGFQHESDLFSNKDLRLAFNYAIDREALVTYTLQGDGEVAKYGIVPTGFKDYEYDSIKGYDFNPELAKEYLAKAGYPDAKGFPELTLQLNSGGSRNIQIAEALQSMIKENLGIELKMQVMPFAQHLENLETGNSLFFRTAWVADYPDPENFLNLFYGKHVPAKGEKSYINSCRYKSEEFDALFEEAQKTVDKKKRYTLYRKADQVAINDGAMMPIYYDEFTRLLQTNVKNFPGNSMEIRDFTEVYFKADF